MSTTRLSSQKIPLSLSLFLVRIRILHFISPVWRLISDPKASRDFDFRLSSFQTLLLPLFLLLLLIIFFASLLKVFFFLVSSDTNSRVNNLDLLKESQKNDEMKKDFFWRERRGKCNKNIARVCLLSNFSWWLKMWKERRGGKWKRKNDKALGNAIHEKWSLTLSSTHPILLLHPLLPPLLFLLSLG